MRRSGFWSGWPSITAGDGDRAATPASTQRLAHFAMTLPALLTGIGLGGTYGLDTLGAMLSLAVRRRPGAGGWGDAVGGYP